MQRGRVVWEPPGYLDAGEHVLWHAQRAEQVQGDTRWGQEWARQGHAVPHGGEGADVTQRWRRRNGSQVGQQLHAG